MNLSKTEVLHRISISPKGVKFKNAMKLPLQVRDIDVRDIELDLLSTCINVMANEATKISEVKQRGLMLDEIENLTDTDNYIDLSKSDIDLIRGTFERIAGKRGTLWARLTELLDQLETPTSLADWAKQNRPENEVVMETSCA
jgi:hypothetical protein